MSEVENPFHESSPAPGPVAGRVLIVEDEPNNQILLQKVLTRMGCEWVCAGDGDAAIAEVAAGDFALILMDLSLPGLDGWSAIQAIRGSGKMVAIVATSAHAMLSDKQRAASLGCNDYITKPFNLGELRRIVEKYVVIAGR